MNRFASRDRRSVKNVIPYTFLSRSLVNDPALHTVLKTTYLMVTLINFCVKHNTVLSLLILSVGVETVPDWPWSEATWGVGPPSLWGIEGFPHNGGPKTLGGPWPPSQFASISYAPRPSTSSPWTLHLFRSASKLYIHRVRGLPCLWST